MLKYDIISLWSQFFHITHDFIQLKLNYLMGYQQINVNIRIDSQNLSDRVLNLWNGSCLEFNKDVSCERGAFWCNVCIYASDALLINLNLNPLLWSWALTQVMRYNCSKLLSFLGYLTIILRGRVSMIIFRYSEILWLFFHLNLTSEDACWNPSLWSYS